MLAEEFANITRRPLETGRASLLRHGLIAKVDGEITPLVYYIIGYGEFSPATIIDAGPIQIEAKDSGLNTQNIVVIALGVIALFGSVMSKKK